MLGVQTIVQTITITMVKGLGFRHTTEHRVEDETETGLIQGFVAMMCCRGLTSLHKQGTGYLKCTSGFRVT